MDNDSYLAFFFHQKIKCDSCRIHPFLLGNFLQIHATAFGKPNLTVHKLRHSFGTRFHIENGADPVLIQRAMRHKNIETTMIYTHVDNKKLKKAFRKANQ
ncbi:tyrosine-type recombinase/integrase [Brevibacillus sp. NPDC003359]|uniref:tyrosine-type recombinase/integrase n=1 Tax=unclassified Brevibacillus TaxID=2684853 RepID=UPI0036B91B93